jgi:RNA polymerase sigma-70 factor (sigma-E family)
MTHENGATVSNLWTDRPSDGDEVREVQVSVPRTRDAEFTAFVRDSGAYLHRTAYLLCGDPHRAEELVQSTFERVYRNWAKVRPDTQRAYARRILVNLRIDSWRHGRREWFPGDDKIPVAATSDHAAQVVLRDELVRGLAQLPTSQRRVVVLRHLLDLPEAEVARELGLAVGTVKAANSRGLARLRDLLRAGTEAIEPVEFDEQAVLDRSRAALLRRRAAQALGAACVVLLLALGVVTRGPVPLPVVGPVVLPGGQLIAPLLEDGRADSVRPGPTPAGNTPVACPEEVPEPTPARAAEPGENLGGIDDPVVVDTSASRPLTCYDVDIEAVTPGSFDDDTGVPVADDGEPLPVLGGLSETGDIWAAVVRSGPGGAVDEAFVSAGGYRGAPIASIPTETLGGVVLWPLDLAARSGQVTWGETTGGVGPTHAANVRTFRTGQGPRTLAAYEGRLWHVAATRDHALWTDGAEYNNTRLLTTPIDDPGTPTELATGVTAIAADDDEVVAAVLSAGSGGTSTTSIRLFDDLAGGDPTGTTLFEVEHDSLAEVTAIAVSDDVVAWAVVPINLGSQARVDPVRPEPLVSTLYVVDRLGERNSIVQQADRGIDGLRASGGLITWNSTVTAGEGSVSSYLYRATPSASGYDGPDLARFPGDSASDLAGSRTAWLENQGRRHWLVEGAVTPTLDRD